MGKPRRGLLMLAALLLAVPLAGIPASAALADPSTGSITGHIDTNGVPRTDVYVTLFSSALGWVNATNVDGSGTFQFTGLAPGDYQVEFTLGNGIEQWYHGRAPGEQPDPVTVVAGQDTAIADQTLPTGSITGTFVDHDGNPILNTLVSANSTTGAGHGYSVVHPDGQYSMDLLPGDYVVNFSPPGYPTDYVPQSPSQSHATVFTVTAGGTLTVNEQLPATGSISGRYTTADGQPVANAFVNILNPDQSPAGYASTDANGNYQVTHVFAGDYRVLFYSPDFSTVQYAYRKLSFQDADAVTVVANADTVVNDSQLPTGSLTITATDAVTHQPIADFCAGSDQQQGCSNGTGMLTLSGVRQGNQTYYVYTNDGHYFGINDQPVTITGGATTTVTASLRPGATINTVITDSVTGAPVANACAATMTGTAMVLPDGSPYCSDGQGIVHIGPLEAGTYQLFVRTPDPYGDQFVGGSGGVGSLDKAKRITLQAGQTVSQPAIRLDHAGTVTGTVTDSSGVPQAGAVVTDSAIEPGPGPTGRTVITDAAGHYTLTGLGPYAWPLLFIAGNQAQQWSGGVGNRNDAMPVRLTAGGTVTYNARLVAGVALSGTVKAAGGGPVGPGRVIVYNAATGDPIGVDEVENGAYRLPILGSQTVKLRFETYQEGGPQGWFGGSDFAHAKSVDIHKKDLALDITVG